MVQVPGIIIDAQQRADYVAEHYWDALLDTATIDRYLCDSSHVAGVDRLEMEQSISNFAYSFDFQMPQLWKKTMERFYGRLRLCENKIPGRGLMDTLVCLTDRYLYDPNSPVRNEDAYRWFLSARAADTLLPRSTTDRAAREAELCSLCSVGTQAADFRFLTAAGEEYRLSDFDSAFTVLFFSNPGCHACLEIIETLTADELFASLTAEGKVSVLNVYIDQELDEWFKYMSSYPADWYNGYDPDYVVRNDELYHLRAIPSIYLLDKNKTVMLKDTTPQKILGTLRNVPEF